MADNRKMANDGYTVLQKGWTPRSPEDKPSLGSGGVKPPTSGSAVRSSTTGAFSKPADKKS
jgi:hypothetical protein